MIVEDDETLGNSLKSYLQGEGFEVNWAKNIEQARGLYDQANPQVLILDWMLPDGQGIDYLKEIRNAGLSVPVIMLTARTEVIDKVVGLESGANDYMTKPFEPRELIARIRVQLRLPQSNDEQDEQQIITAGDIVIDHGKREVTFKNNVIELTKMEFNFLSLLAESPNRAFSREEILNKVWGYENYPSTRTVDTHVLQLRNKLYDELIETVRGVGYRLKL
jgi:DNA-binding response OmpR family regulator